MSEIKDIRIVEKKDCCGCGACYNSCPVDAIRMEWDEEGFYYPYVEEEKCIQCGKCVKVCPSVHPRFVNNEKPECYAAYTGEAVREISSSGGIFTLAAEYVLEQGGAVCGAAFDEDFKLSHTVITDKADLDKLRKSKYIQSTTKEVYRDIGRRLKEGQYVLFCGCSCQVAGLYGYLQKDYEKLFTIDLICHGGPSPMVFEKYLKEIHGDKKITNVDFRDKEYFGWCAHMTVKYADGGIYRKYRSQDPFFRIFLPCFAVRPHCRICKFSRLPRQADMTLGDFWGIEKYNPAYTDGRGTSILVTNSKKGQELLNIIKPRLALAEQVELNHILTHGQPFAKPFRSSPKRDPFMKLVQKFPLVKALECCENDWFDIGLYGDWAKGYGSVMSYYALANTIENMGYTTLLIEKQRDEKQAINQMRKFAQEGCAAVSTPHLAKEMAELNKKCTAFMIGPGPKWGDTTFKNCQKDSYLDFAAPYKKRMAYGISCKEEDSSAPNEKKKELARLLKKFECVSAGEKKGPGCLKSAYHVKGTWVLDPIFLQGPEFYHRIAKKSSVAEKEKYILSYIVNPTPEVRQMLLEISERKGLKLVNILEGISEEYEENKKKLDLPGTLENVRVEDWLFYLEQCEFLVTDSCQGAGLGILFQKDFICVEHEKNQSSGLWDLAETFQLQDRVVKKAEEIRKRPELLEPIKYAKIVEILEQEKENSNRWLQKALSAKPHLYGRIRYGSKFAVIRGLKKIKASIPTSVKEKVYPMLKKNKIYMKYFKRL